MARDRALANAPAIAEGRDPRRRFQQVPTFAQANETVIAVHAKHWKSARTEGQWRSSMRDHVLPRLARKRVDAVTTADVMAVLLPIWPTKRVTAGRVRQRIGAVMKWAVAQGYRDDNPAGEAISAALPKAAVRKQHMRALPHAEVGTALARVKGSGAWRGTLLAFEFLVLTAARSGDRRARPPRNIAKNLPIHLKSSLCSPDNIRKSHTLSGIYARDEWSVSSRPPESEDADVIPANRTGRQRVLRCRRRCFAAGSGPAGRARRALSARHRLRLRAHARV